MRRKSLTLSRTHRTQRVLAPANLTTQNTSPSSNRKCDILVADRCIHKSGKSLNGSEIIHYADLVEKEFDAVIVTSDYHYDAIVTEVNTKVSRTFRHSPQPKQNTLHYRFFYFQSCFLARNITAVITC